MITLVRVVIALTLLVFIVIPAHAQRPLALIGGPGSGGASTYTGLCDVSGGCAEALSVTHALVGSYEGPLFQVIRSDGATLDIQQTANRTPDLNELYSFAGGGEIWISKIYAQVTTTGANDVPVYVGSPTYGPSCPSTLACAAPFWIDPSTGLPLFYNVLPSLFINNSPAEGVDGGTHATSVVFYGRNDRSGAEEGITHPVNGEVAGTDFSPVNTVALGGSAAACSGISNQWCWGVDEEEPSSGHWDGGPYGQTQMDILGIVEWDGVSATNTVSGYINGTQVFTNSPPDNAPLDSGTDLHIGTWGDGGNAATEFRDMAVFNEALTSSQRSAIQNNEDDFYAAASVPAACRGSADAVGYYNPGNPSGNSYSPLSRTVGAWGLYQMRASYYGPIADLNNGSTTETFSAASSGCEIAPAAVTFCASGCTVTKLYQQSDWNTELPIGTQITFGQTYTTNQPDPLVNMTVPSGKSSPTVTFDSLNGAPTMHFAGGAELCTGAPENAISSQPFTFAVVARRTTNVTTDQVALAADSNAEEAGFANTANTAAFASPLMTEAAADNVWHSLAVEFNGSVATPYVDGTPGSGASSAAGAIAGATCIGGDDSGANLMTGDIAEAVMINNSVLTSSGMGSSSSAAAIFALEEKQWGGL